MAAVAVASAMAGVIAALRRRPMHTEEFEGGVPGAGEPLTAPVDPFEQGRRHERERLRRLAHEERLHEDLARIERALNAQTRVLQRALNLAQQRRLRQSLADGGTVPNPMPAIE